MKFIKDYSIYFHFFSISMFSVNLNFFTDCTTVWKPLRFNYKYSKRRRGRLQHCHVDGVKILHSSLVLDTTFFASASYLLFLGIYICMRLVTDGAFAGVALV